MTSVSRSLKREQGLTDVLRAVKRSTELGLHTAMPGCIVSYNASTQTADVQPCFSAVAQDWKGGEDVASRPVLRDLPVAFPRAASGYLTFPLTAGDRCLLIVSERSLEDWKLGATDAPPPLSHTHELTDSFVIPGGWPEVSPITPPPSSTDVTVKGTTGVTVDAVTVSLGELAAEPVVKGTTLASLLSSLVTQINTAFNTHIHSYVPPAATATGPSITPTVLSLDLTAAQSTKVKVE